MPKSKKNKNNQKKSQKDVTPSQQTTNRAEPNISSNETHTDETSTPSVDGFQLNSNNENVLSNVLSENMNNLNLQDRNENPAVNNARSIENISKTNSSKKFQSLNLNVNISPTLRMKFLPPRPDKGGKMGKRIPLIINCLDVVVNPMKIYMYDIELTKADLILTDKTRDFTKKMKNRENLRGLVTKFLEDKCKTPIFDGGRIIFTNQLLPFSEPVKEFNFEYTYENQKVNCFLTLQRVNNKIDLNEINSYVNSGNGRSDTIPQECIRILDLIMKHMFIKWNLVFIGNRGIFNPNTFSNIPKFPYTIICGYFTTIRPHMSKIRFNIDTTQIVCHQPINMKDYIERSIPLRNFNINNTTNINRQIRNLRVKANHYKNKEGNEYSQVLTVKCVYDKNAEEDIIEDLGLSVNDYFLSTYGIKLKYPKLLLIEMVNSNKLPAELLTVLPNQKVIGNNPDITREVIKFSAVPCPQRLENLQDAIQSFNSFNENEYLKNHKVFINSDMITVYGRILDEPMAYFGGKEEQLPKSKFNMAQKKFKNVYEEPIIWALFAFGRREDYGNEAVLYKLEEELPAAVRKVNMRIKREEKFDYVTLKTVRSTIKNLIDRLKTSKEELDLLLVVVRDDEEYKIVKDIGDIELGIVSQCINYNNLCRQRNLSQYMANVMLKINAKLGGTNWEVKIQFSSIKGSFMVFGIDVTHPSSIGDELQKSIAAMVGSINSTATVYSAVIRKQLSKDGKDIVEIVVEMQDMVYQLLKAFSDLNNSKLPEHLIFYRDGVSEGQFELVFNHEITAIKYACEQLKKNYNPKLTYIVVQKRHNIRFFPKNLNDGVGNSKNVPAGVVVDQDITHSREFDFYLCSHEGIQGTSKPAHYHVLFDENKWTSDDLQNFTYFLCYACFRCTRSISYPAPTYYAHLAAFRGRILKENDDSFPITMNNSYSEILINEFHQNKMFFI